MFCTIGIFLLVAKLSEGLVLPRQAASNAPEQIRISLGKDPNSMVIMWTTMQALNSRQFLCFSNKDSKI